MSEAAVDTIERGAFQRVPQIQAIVLNKNRLSQWDFLFHWQSRFLPFKESIRIMFQIMTKTSVDICNCSYEFLSEFARISSKDWMICTQSICRATESTTCRTWPSPTCPVSITWISGWSWFVVLSIISILCWSPESVVFGEWALCNVFCFPVSTKESLCLVADKDRAENRCVDLREFEVCAVKNSTARNRSPQRRRFACRPRGQPSVFSRSFRILPATK